MLPDNALLDIFEFYKADPESNLFDGLSWTWKILTQVCQRWRYIVLGSPRRLDLRVVCTENTPTCMLLDIWPPFPICVMCLPWPPEVDEKGVEDIVVALKHCDRISDIHIAGVHGSALGKVVAAMQEPFPTLRSFILQVVGKAAGSVPVLPETFLGGSAPHLRSFYLHGIPFPKLVLPTTCITELRLTSIPHSGYISPDAMVTCLATLPNLECLSIGFPSRRSRPLQISLPPLTRTVLPALIHLRFSGVGQYLEDFIARIDTPLLNQLIVTFFLWDLISDINIPRLCNFIDRTECQRPFNQAKIRFSSAPIRMILGSKSPTWFELEIKCERPDWQLLLMTQIFSQHLPLLSHVEHLQIDKSRWVGIGWRDDPEVPVGSSRWLELFQLFIAVQSLHVSQNMVPHVAVALRELSLMGEMAMEVLPALRNLSLEGLEPSGPVQKAIESFVTARQLSDCPVTIQDWAYHPPFPLFPASPQ